MEKQHDLTNKDSLFEEIMRNRGSDNSYGNPDDSLDIGDIFLAMREDREK